MHSLVARCLTTTIRRVPQPLRFLSTIVVDPIPILDMTQLDDRLYALQDDMASSLQNDGYFTTTDFLTDVETRAMRDQSIALRAEGRFEQSWSEAIGVDGVARRFDKKGVFATEPDGADYETAPDILVYMSWLLQRLPPALNDSMVQSESLSNQAFNAKLAFTQPGGSTYPLHIDNPQGLAANDTRKLTTILYLNPDYVQGDGGELRVFLRNQEIRDCTPVGGRLLLFWSDEIPHEVLPTCPNADPNDVEKDRYALTVWIPTDAPSQIHSSDSKFKTLRDEVFK